MTLSRHDAIANELAAYANGSLDITRRAALEQHVRSCAACSADLAAWVAIGDAVRPADDAPIARDRRVLTHVLANLDDADLTEAALPVATVPPPPLGSTSDVARSGWARPGLRLAAAAAVVAFAIVAVQPLGQPSAEALLRTAAATVSEWGSALMTVEGETNVALGAATAAEAGEAFTLDFTITGEGALQAPDRAQVRFTLALQDPGQGGDARSEDAEMIRVGEQAWTRTEERWTLLSDGAQPGLGLAQIRPDLATLLGSASGPLEDLGREQVDGVTTRRIAFYLPPDAADGTDAAAQQARVEVWIDDEGVVRQFRQHMEGPSSDPPAYIATQLTARLHDFGTTVDIQPPSTIDP